MLIKKGAEASIYLEEWCGRKVIFKRRHPKKHRMPELDREIQIQRTKHEPQMIHRAKEAGVPTPIIYTVDLEEASIIMEFVEGKQIKQILAELSSEERISLCYQIGKIIGRLHKNGIIHGDLTTSNMILTPYGNIVLIDFGLSEQSMEVEARGVDLHLMKRALASTHYEYSDECFKAIIKGYGEIMGVEAAKAVLNKMMEIEKRGRYVSER
ncbi:Kae1-associated serine/threonine protein kinase [Candidatus Bathyarchaeota archaeon]|nr:Kae1-associated serine/threonine protein kinase [Candidatus Bathyarchaeota archaeon]